MICGFELRSTNAFPRPQKCIAGTTTKVGLLQSSIPRNAIPLAFLGILLVSKKAKPGDVELSILGLLIVHYAPKMLLV